VSRFLRIRNRTCCSFFFPLGGFGRLVFSESGIVLAAAFFSFRWIWVSLFLRIRNCTCFFFSFRWVWVSRFLGIRNRTCCSFFSLFFLSFSFRWESLSLGIVFAAAERRIVFFFSVFFSDCFDTLAA